MKKPLCDLYILLGKGRRYCTLRNCTEGDIGVCGIGPFFLRYFGNFNLELRYFLDLRDAVF